jgi:hypothetical protein
MRRASGILDLAATEPHSGWHSLAGRPLHDRHTTSAMRELAAMVAELNAGEEVRPRAYDRWRFGQCAPLVQGMSGFYRKVQVSLKALDGLEPILSDDSFRDAEALEATEARLSAWRRQLTAIEAEVGRSAQGLRRQIEAASISSDMREHLLAGVDGGLEGGPERLTGSLVPLLDAVERVVTFLKTRRGRYWHEGPDLVFETDADAAGFNRLLDGVREEQNRLQGLVAANQKRAQEKAGAFGRWAQDPFHQPRPPRD